MWPPKRRPEDLATGVDAAVPYDRTGLMEDPNAPAAAGPLMQEEGAPAPMDLGQMGQEQQPAPMDLGAMAPSQQDMGGGGMDMAPEDIEVEQLAAALDDPSTPPDQKAQIQQQLALAARRQLAGLGG